VTSTSREHASFYLPISGLIGKLMLIFNGRFPAAFPRSGGAWVNRVTALHHLHDPPSFIDDIDRDLKLYFEELVEDYRDIAATHGIDEASLRALLSDGGPLDYPELGDLYGVSHNVFLGWWKVAKRAAREDRPVTLGGFARPDIDKTRTTTRLWAKNRAIIWGWRNDRLVPGSLVRAQRTPPGRAARARFAA